MAADGNGNGRPGANGDHGNGNGNGNGDGNGNGYGLLLGPPRPVAVLWPAFVIAAFAEFVVFALLDPAALHLPSGESMSRPAAYTVGFFVFWALGALSSALTLYLLRGPVHPAASAQAP